jgi:asparagine synthase (glutamine-hydrolysing)
VKALLAGGAISTDPDPAGVAGFYVFGSVPEPFTTYAAIKPLLAGTTLLIGPGGAGEARSYFNIAEAYLAAEDMAEQAKPSLEAIRSAVLDSVRHHLVADVPVGAFLSAGIDSGALVGLMRDAGQSKIKTVTLGFAEFANTPQDETPLAQEVARQYGTSHTTRFVIQREFEDDFPRILAAMDQPSIDGVNTWFVSKAAHELGLKVAISGLGGDELFGGYPSFTGRLASRLRWPGQLPLIPRASRQLASALLRAKPRVSQKWAGLLEYGGSIEGAYLLRRGLFMPWELPQLMGRDMALEGLRRLQPLQSLSNQLEPRLRSGFAKLAILESATYMRNQLLRDTDWASMAHSLEVRVPLVDRTLLEACAPHTLGFSRSATSCKALLALSPKLPLPQAVIVRAKTGFTTPIGRWLRTAIVNTNPAGALPAGEVSRSLARSILPGVATDSSVNQGRSRGPAVPQPVCGLHGAVA